MGWLYNIEMSKHNPFEMYFKRFVIDFGGAVLAEAESGQTGIQTADYFFAEHNVIAELKTLMADSSVDMDAMLSEAWIEWGGDITNIPVKIDSNNLPYIEQSDIPDEIRKKWMGKLFQQVERNIKSANKQIADTKARFGLPDARGVILIANAANTYHNNPLSYREALGALVLKQTPTGERKYTQIDRGVYFSNELPSRIEKMPFWAPFHLEQPDNSNGADIQAFLSELRQSWYGYIEKTKGVTVRQHQTD
jgi:hypothetical protein